MKIDVRELIPSELSMADEAGQVYFWRDRVLRGVPAHAATRIHELIACGVIEELTKRHLIPRTVLSDVKLDGCALVLEHERVPVTLYPHEWCFSMLKRAAMSVAEVNYVANLHGCELSDAHAFNVLPDGFRSVWVDIGSLIARPVGARGWPALEQYCRAFLYPLRIWADGAGMLARGIVASGGMLPHAEMLIYRYPFLRAVGQRRLARILENIWRLKRLSRASSVNIRQELGGWRARAVERLKSSRWTPFQNVDSAALLRKVAAIKRRDSLSLWGDYQASSVASVRTARFDRLVDWARQLGVSTALDLGGNRGWFSARLLRESQVNRAISVDADELAVDSGYGEHADTIKGLHLGVLDFVRPVLHPRCAPPAERLASDMVFVLAVTHHILLSQQIPMRDMMAEVRKYSRRYVAMEFMPLGLWNGKRDAEVPEWYTQENFQAAFAEHFDIVSCEVLEPNRILYLGVVRGAPGLAVSNKNE
jgi:hypothetical protein